MARKMQILLEDDLTGELLDEQSGETVSFGVDGTNYEIELSSVNAEQLRAAFARYIDAGRKVSATASTATKAGGGVPRRPDLAAIRTWAAANGHQVSPRGRIPATVVASYDAAHRLQ